MKSSVGRLCKSCHVLALCSQLARFHSRAQLARCHSRAQLARFHSRALLPQQGSMLSYLFYHSSAACCRTTLPLQMRERASCGRCSCVPALRWCAHSSCSAGAAGALALLGRWRCWGHIWGPYTKHMLLLFKWQ
jgi:hypothetical protein